MSNVPSGDATGAATGLGVILVILALLVGGIALAVRSSRRRRREEPTSDADPVELDPVFEVEPNLGGMGLAFAAALLAIVSVFLPALESTAFAHIVKNTLIQGGDGWIIIGCAVAVMGAVYRTYSKRTTTWSVFVLGAIILGVAIYDATGDRTKLHGTSLLGQTVEATATPAVGIYAAGAAGALAMFAGLILAGHVFESYEGGDRRTKTCPDCAETVLAAARICKHCGHEFESKPFAEQNRPT